MWGLGVHAVSLGDPVQPEKWHHERHQVETWGWYHEPVLPRNQHHEIRSKHGPDCDTHQLHYKNDPHSSRKQEITIWPLYPWGRISRANFRGTIENSWFKLLPWTPIKTSSCQFHLLPHGHGFLCAWTDSTMAQPSFLLELLNSYTKAVCHNSHKHRMVLPAIHLSNDEFGTVPSWRKDITVQLGTITIIANEGVQFLCVEMLEPRMNEHID